MNMTMTLSLLELGSKRAMALEKASAWLVLPPAERESTAFFKVDTEVISWVFCWAVSAKLTDADVAAGADLTGGLAAGGLGDDVDEGLRAGLHVGQRGPGHTAGAVQYQRNVSGGGNNIRSGSEGQRDFQGAVTVDPIRIDHFIRFVIPIRITSFGARPQNNLCAAVPR